MNISNPDMFTFIPSYFHNQLKEIFEKIQAMRSYNSYDATMAKIEIFSSVSGILS